MWKLKKQNMLRKEFLMTTVIFYIIVGIVLVVDI